MELLWGTDTDMSPNGYFTVLPTPSATKAAPIIIKCDYTLNADDGSGETIKVTGATAAIPAAFSKWEVNTRYTYLFKISDKTNGTTGDPNNPKDDPAGLYPITFDAVVTEMTDKTQGTTTTVALNQGMDEHSCNGYRPEGYSSHRVPSCNHPGYIMVPTLYLAKLLIAAHLVGL